MTKHWRDIRHADLILINRIDELSPAQLTELHTLLDEQYPDTPRLAGPSK